MFILLLSFGIMGIWLFYQGVYLPILVSAAVIALVTVYLIWLYQQSRVGPLTMLLFLVYVLPFIHVFSYLWFDFNAAPPSIFWGLAVNQYMTDKTIVELMSMMGAVGATGFAVGAPLLPRGLSVDRSSEEIAQNPYAVKTLSIPVFWVWVIAAIILSWISAPVDTLFTAAYTQSKAINDTWNFSSAWMLSYAFLIFALADSMFEPSPRIGGLKRKIVLYAILLIVIYFQLLRGDRESLTLVIAAILMYFVWGKGLMVSAKDRLKVNWPIMLLMIGVVLVVSNVVGVVRQSLTGVGSVSDFMALLSDLGKGGVFGFDRLISGTWSGVLLTPLSVAGDYINGSLPLNYGQTYLDLLASVPPGFLADWVGYARPIDALQGPAWEMRYGLGGTHAVVVPFINFRMTGVFMIVALWSFAFAKIERYSIKHFTVSSFSLLGIIAVIIPHWLWYGEKYIMNALIIWLMLSALYRLRQD